MAKKTNTKKAARKGAASRPADRKASPTKGRKGGKSGKGSKSGKGGSTRSPAKSAKPDSFTQRQASPATTATTAKTRSPNSASAKSLGSRSAKSRKSKSARRLEADLERVGLEDAKDDLQGNDDDGSEDSSIVPSARRRSPPKRASPTKTKGGKPTKRAKASSFLTSETIAKNAILHKVHLTDNKAVIAYLASIREGQDLDAILVAELLEMDHDELLDTVLSDTDVSLGKLRTTIALLEDKTNNESTDVEKWTRKKLVKYLTSLVMQEFDHLDQYYKQSSSSRHTSPPMEITVKSEGGEKPKGKQ